ncbi:GRB10-interacting GYF protein 2 isoform X2 [Elgaria multicarinata webbii]|uniref:GRB10-interacting GYF protein 2 isoform X2 n=1 Tax=Elgaria multicarinata webbii TaxID=159646 RepID=UPI002FCD07A3
MAAETQTLNFGPEWLRALSSGGSVTSPPLSPALPKYKLADYRYGREEMLALFLKDNKIPSDLQDKEFLPILQEEPLPPLALVPFTEEEQRNFSMSVNSAAVVRLMGRGGGGTVVGAPRGRSSSRGRGRGRGESGFYQRSFDDVEGGFGRGGGREMHRSQSWEERGDRRFEKPGRKEPVRPNFEDVGTVTAARKHEFIRSESENWRIFREEQNGEDDDGGWRLTGSRRDGERWRPHSPDGPRSAGWREQMERRRRFEFDFRDRDDERGYRRVRCGSGSMEDDSLPEWCLEDAEEEMGTFDSSGAFLSLKKVQKEPIPEEQEMDFRPVEEGEERSDSEGSHNEEAKELDKTHVREAIKTERTAVEVAEKTVKESSPSTRSGTPPQEPLPASLLERREDCVPEVIGKTEYKENQIGDIPTAKVPNREEPTSAVQPLPPIPPDAASPVHLPSSETHPKSALRPVQTSVTAAPGMGSIPADPDDEEGLKHLEQQAEKMVAYLQDSALDDERLAAKLQEQRAKGTSVPLHHEAMQKWFYKDPQGEIQGPFSNQEMTEWFQAGYFTMSLLVKRACDESFQPLGDIMKMWGRVPFTPGPAPPLHMGELDQERLTRQQEYTAMYQMQHLQYQQFLLQQQYAQVMAQQQKAALSSQQQQQLALLLQQFQALKMRKAEQNMPPVTRSVSVPDTGSIWELQSAAPQATVWEGSSVWDLPIDTTAQGPALEQLQQLEKAKAAKLEQERREAELRAKREEEERKRQEELRRQQEELIRRQEEERKRREEEELARRKQEEALRRQREQEIALRRQREEEERQQQEETLRRLEERRREEEERRQREELLRKQEEEAAKWAREEEEAKRQLEENRLRMEEEAARQRHEEEEQKRKELELQRQKEIMRQRQQQQEALRRLQQQQQQQQLAQMKLPSSSTWGQQANSRACQSQATLSLAEIQKLEEERERQLREEQRRQQHELMKALQQQQQQQQQKLSGWGNVAKPAATTKSLLEIQQEEARQMQKQQQQQQQQQHHQQQNRSRSTTQHSNLHTSIGNTVWGSLNTNPGSQWASDLVSSIWSNADTKNSNMGFWDDAVKEVGPRNATNKNKSNASISKSIGVTTRQNKKVEEEEKLLKLFQGVNKAQDGFTQWCEQMLHALNTANNLDVPTFVSFLKEVESPYEVHDYIRAYLGDTPEAKEFAKQFLERRAKQKANQQRQQQVHTSVFGEHLQDSVWGINHSSLHSVFQTNQSNNQQSNFEAVQSGKKKKKQKMVRADPSLLGFSVNASSERLNMGEIETLDDY